MAEEPRRMAEGVSAATQTDPAPQPVSPELLSTIHSHMCNLLIAQPTWLPSRIRRTTFQELGIFSPSTELRTQVDSILSALIGFERTYSTYLSTAAAIHSPNPAGALLSALYEFQLRLARPSDSYIN